MKFLTTLAVLFFGVLPVAASAASFKQVVTNTLVPIGNSVITLLYVVGFGLFIFGMLKFFFLSPSDEQRTKGKQFMVWSIAGLVIIFSVWGIVGILLNNLTAISR
jgi:Type IV secretion system pilin